MGNVFSTGDHVHLRRAGDGVTPVDYEFAYDNLKHSAGVAVQWLAPLGIFRFSYAFPLNADQGDRVLFEDEVERFQFSDRPGVLTAASAHTAGVQQKVMSIVNARRALWGAAIMAAAGLASPLPRMGRDQDRRRELRPAAWKRRRRPRSRSRRSARSSRRVSASSQTQQKELKAQRRSSRRTARRCRKPSSAHAPRRSCATAQRDLARKQNECRTTSTCAATRRSARLQRTLLEEVQHLRQGAELRPGDRRRRDLRQAPRSTSRPQVLTLRCKARRRQRAPGRPRQRSPDRPSRPNARADPRDDAPCASVPAGDATLGELAVRFGCELRGDPDIERSSASPRCRTRGRAASPSSPIRATASSSRPRAPRAVVLDAKLAARCPVAALIAAIPTRTYARIAAAAASAAAAPRPASIRRAVGRCRRRDRSERARSGACAVDRHGAKHRRARASSVRTASSATGERSAPTRASSRASRCAVAWRSASAASCIRAP